MLICCLFSLSLSVACSRWTNYSHELDRGQNNFHTYLVLIQVKENDKNHGHSQAWKPLSSFNWWGNMNPTFTSDMVFYYSSHSCLGLHKLRSTSGFWPPVLGCSSNLCKLMQAICPNQKKKKRVWFVCMVRMLGYFFLRIYIYIYIYFIFDTRQS